MNANLIVLGLQHRLDSGNTLRDNWCAFSLLLRTIEGMLNGVFKVKRNLILKNNLNTGQLRRAFLPFQCLMFTRRGNTSFIFYFVIDQQAIQYSWFTYYDKINTLRVQTLQTVLTHVIYVTLFLIVRLM